MQPATLEEWLRRLERLHPREIDLGLERIRAVARELDLPPLDCPVVTVGGTNGKGSCIAILQHILTAAGYRVGSYTSPHLLRYNERVTIAGRAATDAELCEAFSAVDSARGKITLTYFEFGTLAALWLFTRRQPDVLLLEVGLGGRLDAVNIVDPDVAVITSIDMDHQDWLGNDRESIGTEKAGILRAGKPAVCGDRNPPDSVLAIARQLDAQLLRRGEAFDAEAVTEKQWSWRGRNGAGESVVLHELPLPELPFNSAVTALQALQLLPLVVPDVAIAEGLSTARLAGRLQQLRWNGIDLILDVAHNPAAARQLAMSLRHRPVPGRTFCVFAIMQDKDITGVIAALKQVVQEWVVAGLPGVGRAASPARLAEDVADFGEPVRSAADVPAALQQAREQLRSGDRLLVTGSFHTVAAALRQLEEAGVLRDGE